MLRTAVLMILSLFAGMVVESRSQEITVKSLSGESAFLVGEALQKDRSEKVSQLLTVARDAPLGSEPQLVAIALLRELRSEEAVPWLITNIDKVKRTGPSFRPRRLAQEYPCAEALAIIGKQSSRKAVEELGKEDNELRRRLLLYVVQRVEDPVVAVLILEATRLELRRQERIESAKRIESALKMLAPDWGRDDSKFPVINRDRLPTEDRDLDTSSF
jgi:hypothetical protein